MSSRIDYQHFFLIIIKVRWCMGAVTPEHDMELYEDGRKEATSQGKTRTGRSKSISNAHHITCLKEQTHWPLARTSHAATVPRSSFWWAIGLQVNAASPKMWTSLNNAQRHCPTKGCVNCPPIAWVADYSDDDVGWIGSIEKSDTIWAHYHQPAMQSFEPLDCIIILNWYCTR